MLTEDKVTELFGMADDFCKFFDVMMGKLSLVTHRANSLKTLFSVDNKINARKQLYTGL